jgi:hypothetical protein
MPTANLFGTAQRGRTRPRGFKPWRLDAASQALVDAIQAVLEEYAAHLPLTIRQIFYRLVGAHDYPKTEAAYKRLCRIIGRARRARLIGMDAIRDDGFVVNSPHCWTSPEAFLATVQRQASKLMLDRQAGQPTRLVIMCEAAGMVPQLARVAHLYGVTVMASGGFDSLTSKYEFASSCDDDTEVLHIGDHDPSGVHIYSSLEEDVVAFAEEELASTVTFTRLAVTPAQIRRYRLPTAPPKATDRRAFSGQTCQAEALPPDVLAQIVEAAIQQRLDTRQYDRVLRDERKARKWLMERLGAPS